MVNDKAHVELVDAHAKGDRRHHHLHVPLAPLLIDFHSPRIAPGICTVKVQVRMVELGANALALKKVGDIFSLLLREAIDDAGLPLESMLNHVEDGLVCVVGARCLELHLVLQVRAVDTDAEALTPAALSPFSKSVP